MIGFQVIDPLNERKGVVTQIIPCSKFSSNSKIVPTAIILWENGEIEEWQDLEELNWLNILTPSQGFLSSRFVFDVG